MNQSELTTLILCKNGEQTLERCLLSENFSDRIIVGDDSSTDLSISIARRYHADIIKVPAGQDFSSKRNFLLDYVRTEWALFVDTDEVVSKELAMEIENGQWRIDNKNGYRIPRNDIFMGKKLLHGETAHTKLLRLARVGTGKWKREVHEVWDVTGEVGELSGELLHFPHPNLEGFFDKINRYTEYESESRIKNQESRTSLLFASGFQLLVFPLAKFIQNYFFRFGLLDGYPGFIMAWMMSFHSLCVRIKVLEKLLPTHER